MSLSEIDLTNPDNFVHGAPHRWFKQLRSEAPLYWHEEEEGPGFWNVTKYHDLRQVSRNPHVFSSQRGGTNMRDPRAEERAQFEGQRSFPIMLMMDPPQHVKFRRIVQRSFTPRFINKLEAHIRELSKQIIDNVVERGDCEFVSEVAAELPLQVICEMMGVPQESRHDIYDISNRMIGFDDPELAPKDRAEAQGASLQMFQHATKTADLYRNNPTDNLTSALLHKEVDGEKLNEIEYAAFFLLLCVAGNETTRTVTTNGMKLLIEHPDQLQELVDNPALVESAVEEILRFEPAVHHFRRTATQETEIRGHKIRENDKIVMWYPSANRDEEIFDDPDTFDIHRNPNEHLSFGIGEHFCLGANLARLELNAIFDEIIPRLRNPQLIGPERRLRSNFINGVKEMKVSFTPDKATG